jgi:hypothetical protein
MVCVMNRVPVLCWLAYFWPPLALLAFSPPLQFCVIRSQIHASSFLIASKSDTADRPRLLTQPSMSTPTKRESTPLHTPSRVTFQSENQRRGSRMCAAHNLPPPAAHS